MQAKQKPASEQASRAKPDQLAYRIGEFPTVNPEIQPFFDALMSAIYSGRVRLAEHLAGALARRHGGRPDGRG